MPINRYFYHEATFLPTLAVFLHFFLDLLHHFHGLLAHFILHRGPDWSYPHFPIWARAALQRGTGTQGIPIPGWDDRIWDWFFQERMVIFPFRKVLAWSGEATNSHSAVIWFYKDNYDVSGQCEIIPRSFMEPLISGMIRWMLGLVPSTHWELRRGNRDISTSPRLE